MENPRWFERNYRHPGLDELAWARKDGPFSYGNFNDNIEEHGSNKYSWRLKSLSLTSFIAWGDKSKYHSWIEMTSKEAHKIDASCKEWSISSDTLLWYLRHETIYSVVHLLGEENKHFQDPHIGWMKPSHVTHSLASSVQRAVRDIDPWKLK